MHEFQSKLLQHLKISAADYEYLTRSVTVSDLPYPYIFHDFEKFSMRIEQALRNNEKILIYGDYDADGILATSILKYAFAVKGVDVFTFIPSRYKEGYGLNKDLIAKFKARGITLIITVDNGITAHEAIAEANKYGIDVLVSDHHALGPTLPAAHAIMHPFLANGDTLESAGAYVALVISYIILNYFDDYLVALAAIATIADMMPLLSTNRTLVRLGLALLNKHNYPQLRALNESDYYDAEVLAMKIIPQINALGRLSKERETNVLVEYFTTNDSTRIKTIAAYVRSVNEKRRALSADALTNYVDESAPAIVLKTNELEGMLGLISQRYVNAYKKPAILFSESSSDPTILKGSARSYGGFSLIDAFTKLSRFLETYGGHNEAAGLSIKETNLPDFTRAFNALVANTPLVETKEHALSINFSDLTLVNAEFVQTLAPFGMGHRPPRFIVRDVPRSFLVANVHDKHAIHEIERGLKLVSFNYENSEDTTIIIGEFSRNAYRNNVTINFNFTNYS